MRNAAGLAALLLALAAVCTGAIQIQLMVGLYGVFPTVEVSVLTPPEALGGFQQEVGLRFTHAVMETFFDLVLRSWMSFPGSGSDFWRERFRVGLEYSPMLYDYELGGWFPLGFRPGVWTSFRVNDPSAGTTLDFFFGLLGFVASYAIVFPSVGLGFRSPDFSNVHPLRAAPAARYGQGRDNTVESWWSCTGEPAVDGLIPCTKWS